MTAAGITHSQGTVDALGAHAKHGALCHSVTNTDTLYASKIEISGHTYASVREKVEAVWDRGAPLAETPSPASADPKPTEQDLPPACAQRKRTKVWVCFGARHWSSQAATPCCPGRAKSDKQGAGPCFSRIQPPTHPPQAPTCIPLPCLPYLPGYLRNATES